MLLPHFVLATTYEVGATIIISHMREWRHREVKKLAEVTEPIRGGAGLKPSDSNHNSQCTSLKHTGLWDGARPELF